MRESWRDFYQTLDLRSLALFRIALALLLIHDTATRWPDIEAFYAQTGILPADAPWPRFNAPLQWSPLDALQSANAIRMVFVAGFLAELALLCGYRTRIAQVVSLLFLASVRNRNTLLTHGGDGALAVLCVWALLMPLGARWSMDRRRAARRGGTSDFGAERSSASWVGVAYAVQIGFIYLTTAVAKSGPAWQDGTAVHYALHLDQFTNAFGAWMRGMPLVLLQAMSWGTLALEWAALPMFLAPVAQPWLRRIALIGLAGFHLGTAVTMVLGAFPWVMCASYLPLVRPPDWDALGRLLHRAGFAKAAGALASPAIAPAVANDAATARAARRATSPHRGRIVRDAIAAGLLICVLLDGFNQSFASRLHRDPLRLPLVLRAPVMIFDLGQGWRMFAPEPLRYDGWWVVVGETETGAVVDPLTGQAPRWEKPPHLSSVRSVYWRMYMFNISRPEFRPFQIYFARWLAGRTRPEPPARRLRGLDLWWVQENTPSPGQPPPPLQRFRLWSWDAENDRILRGDV